jgi:Protein of unknown function (DUF3105)
MPQPKDKKTKAAVSSDLSTASASGTVTATPTRPQTRTERRAELFDKRRADRKKAPAKQKRDRLITKIALSAVAGAIIVGLAYGIITWVQDRESRQQPAGVTTYSYTGGDHTADTVNYTESPPVGGPHDAAWQTCDFYDGVIRNENVVHSLEHGAVWITYRPDISGEQKEKLRDVRGSDQYVVVSEYPDQESPIVATAWNNQLAIESADAEELEQFINYYRQGPQTQEPGATCQGGVTTVIG